MHKAYEKVLLHESLNNHQVVAICRRRLKPKQPAKQKFKFDLGPLITLRLLLLELNVPFKQVLDIVADTCLFRTWLLEAAGELHHQRCNPVSIHSQPSTNSTLVLRVQCLLSLTVYTVEFTMGIKRQPNNFQNVAAGRVHSSATPPLLLLTKTTRHTIQLIAEGATWRTSIVGGHRHVNMLALDTRR